MKKILWFSLSLGVSLLIFATVSIVCIILSVSPRSGVDTGQQTSEFRSDGDISEVLLIYVDEPTDKFFAAVLELNMSEKTASARPLTCDQTVSGGKTLCETYKTEGLYPFVDACKNAAGNQDLMFLKLNSNTFVTIADRTEKIVYNNKSEGRILLTGRQAVEILSDENFAEFCTLMASYAFDCDKRKEFLFITDVCENDLSYPLLYTKINGNHEDKGMWD